MRFKKGDRVIGNATNINYVGLMGTIISIDPSKTGDFGEYVISFDNDSTKSNWRDDGELDLINSSNTMNLNEKLALVFKGEPEKSFIKAGVMNTDESLTSEGQTLFHAWLLKKHGADFKTEVVDPIIAEMKNSK